MAEEMEPIARLGRRLRDEAKDEGLTLMRFSVDPNLDGEVHEATAVFFIDEDAPERVEDPEFDALIAGQIKAEQEAKAAQARENMERLRDDLADPSKGLGFDDD